MKRKAINIILTAVLIIAFAACICLLAGQIRSVRLNTEATRFLSQGEYEKARDIFSLLGDDAMVSRCGELIEHRTYLDAKALLSSGEYEAAKELLLTVPEHLDAQELIKECDYLHACRLEDDGDALTALRLFESLGGYSDSADRITGLKDTLYAQGCDLANHCNFYGAHEIFASLGDYLDSETMLKRCDARLSMAEDGSRPIIDPQNLFASFPTGDLYTADTGYIFIPENYGSTTEFLIFFPGGRDIEEPRDYIYNCINASSEDTVILFLYKNGLGDMEGKAEAALDTLKRAADECSLTLKAPLLCGTSMGAYPAMHAAAYYYLNHSLTIPKVLCFDAGVDWEETDLTLSAYECAQLAKAGTEFWLFEQYGVGMNREGINLMAASGCNVTMFVCANQDHNSILYDALDCGMIDWAFGRIAPIKSDNYTYIPLNADSVYPY